MSPMPNSEKTSGENDFSDDNAASFKEIMQRSALPAGTSPGEVLKYLVKNQLMCVGCFLEVHAGQREKANPAVLVVGGNSTCLEHVQIGQAPMAPGRTPSGLILGG